MKLRQRKKNYYHPYEGRRKPLWLKILLAVVLLAVLAFAVLEGLVLSGGRTRVAEGAEAPEVMVVFGCKVDPNGPSILLQDRLDTALAYLEDHPDMTVVVAGGQGSDEPVSEAQAMYDYLVEHGADGDQIIREDRSRNTWQNVNNTLDIFRSGEIAGTDRVLLVSSDFHPTRIQMLWNRASGGGDALSTLAAPVSHFPSRVQMFFREPFALVKSFLFDR